MMLVPGVALQVDLQFEEAALPAARVAMSGGLAQLEWSDPVVGAGLPIDPLLYPPERGLHAARGRTFEGLHGFLADSLPDAWGRLLTKRRLARLGVRIEDLTAVDRLALVGCGGRGALVYRPATTPDDDVPAIDLDALAEHSRQLLLGDEAELIDTLAMLGAGSGGARPKVHVYFAADGSITADGDLPGYEAWIVKFRAGVDPVDIGPIEQAYARMAQAAGIDIAPSRLLPQHDGPGYFATRRFDRPEPRRRLHMLSLAGALEARPDMPSIEYDAFLRATMAITRHAGDLEQAFRRMVFNVLAHNRDDHARQHSYLMDPQGNWRLAPAYDLTFSNGPGGEHYLAIEGEGRMPTRAHVEALGKRHGLSNRSITQIIDSVRGATASWPQLAVDHGVTVSSREIAGRLLAVRDAFDG